MRHLVGCLLEVLHVVSQHQVPQRQEVAVILNSSNEDLIHLSLTINHIQLSHFDHLVFLADD